MLPPLKTKPWNALGVILPFILVAAITGFRYPSALLNSNFWAEDGTVFLSGAFSDGAVSLYKPVLGYHLFLSRCIAYFATFFPVLWAPYLYAWCAWLIHAMCVGYFSREGFSWLIPSRLQRVLVCALLAIAPGNTEVMMNLCNLSSPLAFLAFLMLLEKPFTVNGVKYSVLLLVGISSGHMVCLLPLIILLWLLYRQKSHLLLLVSLMPIVLINLIGNHISGSQTGHLHYERFHYMPEVIVEHFFMRLMHAPLLGIAKTTTLLQCGDFVFLSISLTFLLVFILLLGLLGLERKEITMLLTAFGCTILGLGLVLIVRKYGLELVDHYGHILCWDDRHSFLPGELADMIWCTLLLRLARMKGMVRALGILGLAVLSYHHVVYWKHVAPRSNGDWSGKAALIQHALNKKKAGLLKQPVTVDDIAASPSMFGWDRLSITIKP